MGSGRRFSVVAAVVATVLGVGAGAASAKLSPRDAFNAKVRAIGTQAQVALLAMPTAPAKPSPADSAAMAGQLQVIYGRVATRLAALTPPAPIRANFAIVVVAYRADAKNAGAWRDALLHGTAQQAADASRKLYLGLDAYRASRAFVAMSEKGYVFGSFFR